MAEEKDYVGILWQDQPSWLGRTPEQTLENIKKRLIQEGAKPKTPEYQEAFMNILNRATMASGGGKQRAGGLVLEPNLAGSKALNYLKSPAGARKATDLGLDAALYGLGGATRSLKSGEAIFSNDLYQRDKFGEIEYDAKGNPKFRGTPGETIQNPETNEYLRLENLEVIPDWFNPNNALPGFVEAGIVPGAKITPEMRTTFKKLMGVTTAVSADGTEFDANADSDYDGAGNGTTYTAPDGRIFTDLKAYNTYITKLKSDEKRKDGQSAYDLLFSEFDRYGLGGLIEPLKTFIQDGLSEAEFTLRLRETDAYKKRFAANQARVKNGLRALSEAQYIELEDQYQDVMRRYGMPETYYTRGDMGRQEGFEKFIGGDVSPIELEDRIQTAQNRVVKANPEVSKALREFYPEITGGDILAYALDPAKAIENIKRKVTAAEIGAGAMQAGLKTGLARAEELQRYGVTKETAQQGFGTIASGLERGRQLSQIYQQPDYTQAVAETEVFALPDADKARRQRRKLGQLETTTFSGTSGVTGGALDRERAGQY